MDFYNIVVTETDKEICIHPDFITRRSNDFMIRGKSFYAVLDEKGALWSMDEDDIPRLIDSEMEKVKASLPPTDKKIKIKRLSNFSSKSWSNYKSYLNQMFDNYKQLNNTITFKNTHVTKTKYVSFRLDYDLAEGDISSYEEIMSTLYVPEERAKLEWAIGAIISGDARTIQKFIVLYGASGTGKSTFLNIVQQLFPGYYTIFNAKALTSPNNSFSTEAFKTNPLIAIQHDGDLSKIEDNSLLNSIISHEEIPINEKYKSEYFTRINSFLFMGSNKNVMITDSKSGLIRRLIDVKPSLRLLPIKRYNYLMGQIHYERGCIAQHCLNVYNTMGKDYYSDYTPHEMRLQSDIFLNFVEDCTDQLTKTDKITLIDAYNVYKLYCNVAGLQYVMPRHKFREELKSYFTTFNEYDKIDGKTARNVYSGLIPRKMATVVDTELDKPLIDFDIRPSILDQYISDNPAQYSNSIGNPRRAWSVIKTKLSDIDTSKLHWVKLSQNHIIIDFDLKDSSGNKSLSKNLDAASEFPSTYAEISKSGQGIHLHYIYDGNVEELASKIKDNIEIKIFKGDSALRRQLTKCNDVQIKTISSGLPMKEKGERNVVDYNTVQTEKGLRAMLNKNLNKGSHNDTRSSIDFIKKILDDAIANNLRFDVTDMRQRILEFAQNSTNQSKYCVDLVSRMKFSNGMDLEIKEDFAGTEEVIFFDVEVLPNLLLVCWKRKGEGQKVVTMFNPSPEEIQELMKHKLIGFNCRRYDNHIMYGRSIGLDNLRIFDLSSKIVKNNRNSMYGEAYNLSYADVYDFCSDKMSLKKWQLELWLKHKEMEIKWDEVLPKERWLELAEYCENDVISTEAVFNARKQDFVARQILSDISGMRVNDTTQNHTAKIIFGDDKNPQSLFNYVDLSEQFPGYKFDSGTSWYRDEETGEGGYVYAEPGAYENVAVLDIASMHPTSLIQMGMFGPYTQKFEELVQARLAIKHKEFDKLELMLGGILTKYIGTPEDAKALSYALKIVINSVYGFTAATFENKFKDLRNRDNIVAKRGALFMIDLKHAVREQGFKVVHIKTDSIKIPDATEEIINFVFEFGKKYGYTFEHEYTFDKFCLVNDAVYIAKIGWALDDGEIGKWNAVGAQFAQPYVFKTLFSHEPIEFKDLCETKTVTTSLWLNLNENLPPNEINYNFIGKAGRFCPIIEGKGGGILLRLRDKDNTYHAATGTKGYRWLESDIVKLLGKEEDIDRDYYTEQVNDAIATISKYCDFENFAYDITDTIGMDDVPPVGCTGNCETCNKCPNYNTITGKCGDDDNLPLIA